MTLRPGTIVLTGAPPRTDSSSREPTALRPGDAVVVEIDTIGRLDSTIEAS
jgi:2-keto-4-pentenoate hydratase/2-oxohepta-3-ene-1,7-dioic acid hydratase in catechol pathway